MTITSRLCILLFGLLWLSVATAESETALDSCLVKAIRNASADDTAEALRASCSAAKITRQNSLGKRIQQERDSEYDPFVLTPHRINYILPAYVTSGINEDAYADVNDWQGELMDVESKYQLSLKVPLSHRKLLSENDGIYFAFTVEAWWQTYAESISRPFRETNYRPEFFYMTPLSYRPWGYSVDWMLGFEHQSNGRDQALSRSWNRVFTSFILAKDNHLFYVRPWYRLSEREDRFPGDPSGDDNPDIGDFMGNFEAGTALRFDDKYELDLMFRQNFATSRGAVKATVTFPLWGKLRGYADVFHGYGESLIDYDYAQTRVGIGFALNSIL